MLCRHVVFDFWSCVFQTDTAESCTSFRKSTGRLFDRCGYFRGEPVSGERHYHHICQKTMGGACGNVSCVSVILKRLISRGYMSARTSTDQRRTQKAKNSKACNKRLNSRKSLKRDVGYRLQHMLYRTVLYMNYCIIIYLEKRLVPGTLILNEVSDTIARIELCLC